MGKRWFYYVGYGAPGCLHDSMYGHFTGTLRGEWIQLIRDAMAFYGIPKSQIDQVGTMKTWGKIKRHGSSSIHFSIYYNNMVLEFMGLTKAEYNESVEPEERIN